MATSYPEERRVTTARGARRSEGYWRANLRLQLALLAVWAIVAYVVSIFLADVLNDFTVYGFPIAYWFAQQGSIIIFVILIFVYAITMDRVDHEYGVEEGEVGWARRRLERRMQRQLTGEAPASEAELGQPTGEAERREP